MATATIFELRQYTLRPGKRDVLIELFEREFLEPQAAAGMPVLGSFIDIDRPDRFVWVRGFRDMPARLSALTTFYEGPIWGAHRDTANATMLDSDNVLLLRRAGSDSGPPDCKTSRSGKDGVVGAVVCSLSPDADESTLDVFANDARVALAESGIAIAAMFATERAQNNFPRLPVRENENVFVAFFGSISLDALDKALSDFERSQGFRDRLRTRLSGPMELLRLKPTARCGPLLR